MTKRAAPYDPAAELVTETVTLGLPLRTKQALAEAAARQGKSLSEYSREAVQARIARDLRGLRRGL